MSKELTTNGDTSRIERMFLPDSSSTIGAGLTGLTSASSGLIISTIADVEATAIVYTVAASNIETITTLGTYATPTASKCRFKEVDATNHPGLYEIQLANARYAISNAEKLIITILGATDLAPTFAEIQLAKFDVYSAAMARAISAIALVTVAGSATTTSIPTSSILPAATVADQFKGRILTFADDTVTEALRGQSTDITANTSGGTLTVTALTTAPVSGDIATIQ